MECLFCKKPLGLFASLRLFASRKHPFCSKAHQVAYQAGQTMSAMRRVMDPMFEDSVEPLPVRVTPEHESHVAEDASDKVLT
jgi:hypothetical protein